MTSEELPDQGPSTRNHLIGNRYLVRRGHCTVNGDQVSIALRLPGLDINCGHTIGHIDNQCPDAEILQQFDAAVGGTLTQRGWQNLRFPVWHFTNVTASPSESPTKPLRRVKIPSLLGKSSAMIARTDADCHGNVVDGDQLQTDLDASPRTAATFDHPTSYSLAQALSNLDQLLGTTHNFFDRYYHACTAIAEDKITPDDFFFRNIPDEADALCPFQGGMPNASVITALIRGRYRSRDIVEVSEMSDRFFKNLVFSVKVCLLEKLRHCTLTMFSCLGNEIRNKFALSQSCAFGLLCRLLPTSSVIGVSKCAFAHAKEIDAEGKVVLDQVLTLRDIFLGESQIYGKVLDDRRVLVSGANADDVCMILERRESLHIVGVEKKREVDMQDGGFRRVDDADGLLVGWAIRSENRRALENMSKLSRREVRDVVLQASSMRRALRVLCSRCEFPTGTSLGKRKSLFARGQVVMSLSASPMRSIVRTALVGGMCEGSDEERVEQVLRSMYGYTWVRGVVECMKQIYCEKERMGDKGGDSRIVVLVSTGADVVRSRDEQEIEFARCDDVSAAVAARAGIELGMRIERAGQTLRAGNGMDRMVLHDDVGDDVIILATQRLLSEEIVQGDGIAGTGPSDSQAQSVA